MNPALLSSWLAEVVLITYRASKAPVNPPNPIKGFPVPATYAATFIIYGGLAFVPAGPAGHVAALFGWGLVVATLLNFWDPATVGAKGGPQVKAASPFPTAAAPTTAPGTAPGTLA